MPDSYSNFQELQLHEQEGRDYLIKTSGNWHPVLIIAPHGGKIEPYTSEIAKWIACGDFAWYSFDQLEISFALRKRIFEEMECRVRFIETIKSTIKSLVRLS